MKALKKIFLSIILIFLLQGSIQAQCAMCTKTAQQLGEKPAKGMNTGIIYLMLTPLAIMGIIGYRWWKSNKS